MDSDIPPDYRSVYLCSIGTGLLPRRLWAGTGGAGITLVIWDLGIFARAGEGVFSHTAPVLGAQNRACAVVCHIHGIMALALLVVAALHTQRFSYCCANLNSKQRKLRRCLQALKNAYIKALQRGILFVNTRQTEVHTIGYEHFCFMYYRWEMQVKSLA